MINQLKKDFEQEIKRLKKQYNLVNITEEEFNLLIERELITNFEKYQSGYFGRKKFVSNIWRALANFYQEKLEIERYHNMILSEVEKLLKANDQLKEKEQLYLLSEFLIKINCQLDYSLCQKLLTKSNKLINIINRYIYEIQSKKQELENITLPNNIIILIKCYYSMNNLYQIDKSSKLLKLEKEIMNYKISDIKDEDILFLYNNEENITLTDLEEKRLIIEYKSGIKTAKKRLFDKMQWLVIKAVKKYNPQEIDVLDLIQEGNIALLEAIEKYNFDDKYYFRSYAYKEITKSINEYLTKNGSIIKSTSYVNRNSIKINNAIKKLTIELGRTPTTKELADKLNLTEEKVTKLKTLPVSLISLDEFIEKNDLEDYENNTLVNLEEKVTITKLQKDVKKLIEQSNLTAREKEVIYLRYGFDFKYELTFEEVAKIIGITRSGVNSFEKNALNKFRKMNLTNMSEYMDNPTLAVSTYKAKIKKK